MFKKFSRPATIFYLLGFLFIGGLLVFALPVFAQSKEMQTLGAASGLPQENLVIILARIVRAVLGVLGIIVVLLVIYAGFLYMTAAGDDTKIKKSKKMLQQMVIGLVIIFSSYSIATFVLNKLLEAMLGPGTVSSQAAQKYNEPLAGSLGAGAIETHYPGRDATKVPRNTKIMVTFKEAIKPSTIIEGYDQNPNATQLNLKGVKIYETAKGDKNPLKSEEVVVTFDQTKKTFVFRPIQALGNNNKDTNYTVFLTPELQKDAGGAVFTGIFKSGYQWTFEVSTELDLTPPKVIKETIKPADSSTNPRNTTVQVEFDEAMDVSTISGVYNPATKEPLFQNIQVRDGQTVVSGTYSMTNYRIVDFTTTDACAKDPCGNIIYCLPANKQLSVLLKSASVDEKNIPQGILKGVLYDGIVDASGNSLDGNGDGKACGTETDKVACAGGLANDHFTYGFTTTAEIDSTVPKFISVTPNIGQGDVEPTSPVYLAFNVFLKASTVNTQTVSLWPDPADYSMWFANTLGTQKQFSQKETPGVGAVVMIDHPAFISKLEEGHGYSPVVTEGVRSINQICLYPAAGPMDNSAAVPATNYCPGTDPLKPYCCNGVSQADPCVNSQGIKLPIVNP